MKSTMMKTAWKWLQHIAAARPGQIVPMEGLNINGIEIDVEVDECDDRTVFEARHTVGISRVTVVLRATFVRSWYADNDLDGDVMLSVWVAADAPDVRINRWFADRGELGGELGLRAAAMHADAAFAAIESAHVLGLDMSK